jgi:hypothetical protein
MVVCEDTEHTKPLPPASTFETIKERGRHLRTPALDCYHPQLTLTQPYRLYDIPMGHNAPTMLVQLPPRRLVPLAATGLLLLCMTAWWLFINRAHEQSLVGNHYHQITSPQDAASNSTLGFQKIIALSTGPSWRTRGLQAAAAYTGLDIEILPYVPPSPELVDAFSKIGENDLSAEHRPGHGSATAWLAHLDILKHVVYNGYESALIMEDDVDWDVTIKDQLALASEAVREFTQAPASDTSPYGRHWDLFWIGHCGEATDPETERLEYADPSTVPHADYKGWSARFLDEQISEGHRAVQRGTLPVCSFAYGVTNHGARKILDWSSNGKEEAFDSKLSEAVRHRRRLLDIVTIQPELMHHYQPMAKDGYTSQVREGDGKGNAADETRFEHIMGGTENIPNSARCKVLFDSTCMRPNE